MNFKAKIVVAFVSAVGALAGCAGDVAKRGVQGESCKHTGDCGSGLVCLGFECATASSGLERAENECVNIQCTTAADCCAEGSTACSYTCRDDRCVQSCTSDVDCSGACVGGVCVDCGADDDCPTGYLCIEQRCESGCREDADCPALYACQSSRCVDVGCKTDRECIALLGSVRSVCRDAKCHTPCTSDAQCRAEGSELSICADGDCASIGCQTDSECRARASFDDGETSGRIECRPRSSAH